MDLSALQGKKVAVFVSMIGDQGSGIMTGGRFSIEALIRGEYQNLPKSTTTYKYQTYDTIATTETDGLSGITQSTSLLNAPSYSKTRNEGQNSRAGLGISVNGLGDYKNETLIQKFQRKCYI